MAKKGITRRQLADMVGVTEGAVRYHIRQGNIRPLADGSMNPNDAAVLKQASRIADAHDDRSEKLLKVRVLGGVVKTRRIRLNIKEAQDRVVERAPLEAALRARTQQITDRINTWPGRYAHEVALELGIDVSVADRVLRQFSDTALTELGDIEAEALRLCQMR
jgi:hypothetical protein